MQIVPYRELPDRVLKEQFLPLFEQAFNVVLTPEEGELLIALDDRLRESPVGFCALQGDRLAAFMGVMKLPTRTREGRELKALGIWGGVVSPRFLGGGTARAFAGPVMEYAAEKQFASAFTITNRTILAHALLRRAGWSDLRSFPSAYKRSQSPPPAHLIERQPLDWQKIRAIYEEFIRQKAGLVHGPNLFDLARARKLFDEERSILLERGYALLKEQEGVVRVIELIALDDPTREALLDAIEAQAGKAVIDRTVTDEPLFQSYQRRGYFVQKESYLVLMAQSFSGRPVEEVYGSDLFFTSLDMF